MVSSRKLKFEELPEASRVLWTSYYAAENGKTALEGMTTFRDLTEPLSLQMNSLSGDALFYGAFRDRKLIAVGAVKERRHVLLLYVLPQEQRSGVGSLLLKKLLAQMSTAEVTVNAAPEAVPFYEKHGFSIRSSLQIKDGIRFVPMSRRQSPPERTEPK